MVDPFGIYHTQPSWWIQSRPYIRVAERLHKSHAVRDAQADTLLLGNSRVAIGLNPHHPDILGKCYNLGLSGANVYECYRYLQHAGALHMPKLVVLGIDRNMFNAKNKPSIDFDETRLAVDSRLKPQPGYVFADIGATLFSTRAFIYSVLTLFNQRGPAICYKDGLRDESLMQPFSNLETVLAANRTAIKRATFRAGKLGDESNPQFKAFRNTLTYCNDHHIRLIVFTHPIHAKLLDAFCVNQNEYEEWMCRISKAIQAQYPSTEFWDFCGYNNIAEEAFLQRANTQNMQMRYYWEIGHYKVAVGDFVLSRIFGIFGAPRGFGFRINKSNITEDLTRLKLERGIFKRAWQRLSH